MIRRDAERWDINTAEHRMHPVYVCQALLNEALGIACLLRVFASSNLDADNSNCVLLWL